MGRRWEVFVSDKSVRHPVLEKLRAPSQSVLWVLLTCIQVVCIALLAGMVYSDQL